MQTDILILGGGASGMVAAAALSRNGFRVTILERLDRVGKKILSTGNGRCNLSNQAVSPEAYGKAEPFVRKIFETVPPEAVWEFYRSIGLMTSSEEGRIYPRTFAAASVLDALRFELVRNGADIRTDSLVVSMGRNRAGLWSVQTENGEIYTAPCLIACMGGRAAPKLGTDGKGLHLLASLGHHVTKTYPALVQLKGEHPALRSLKGIRVQAGLTLLSDEKTIASETGELLFTDYGLSGVCIFQLSGLAASLLDQRHRVAMQIHLLPEMDEKAVEPWLIERFMTLRCTALEGLTGVFPRLLSLALLKQTGIEADCIPDIRQLRTLAGVIRAFTVPITGTTGFDHAQLTRGGVSLDEVDPDTLRSRLQDGLYICGESLDVDGPCGGFNLHFAAACALCAARDISEK